MAHRRRQGKSEHPLCCRWKEGAAAHCTPACSILQAEALEAEDPKSKGKGLLQLVPATEMQLAEDVTLLATVLRDCAFDMTEYADFAALSKCLDRLLPERIEEREAAEQAEAAAMAAQENATETDASPEETVPVEESSAPGETEEPAKKPAVKKPSPKKSEP